jgi:hypothetical protein
MLIITNTYYLSKREVCQSVKVASSLFLATLIPTPARLYQERKVAPT